MFFILHLLMACSSTDSSKALDTSTCEDSVVDSDSADSDSSDSDTCASE